MAAGNRSTATTTYGHEKANDHPLSRTRLILSAALLISAHLHSCTSSSSALLISIFVETNQSFRSIPTHIPHSLPHINSPIIKPRELNALPDKRIVGNRQSRDPLLVHDLSPPYVSLHHTSAEPREKIWDWMDCDSHLLLPSQPLDFLAHHTRHLRYRDALFDV